MSNKVPIQIVPFPNETQFTSNTINITDEIYDFRDEDKIFDHKGNYTISSSSYYDNTCMPFNAFNGSNKLFWKTNNIGNSFEFSPSVIPYTRTPYKISDEPGAPSIYQGGGTQSSNYFKTTVIVPGVNPDIIYGEWLQIQLPRKIRLTKYTLLTPAPQNDLHYFPLEFTTVGSHNGTDWYYVDQQRLQTPPDVSKRIPVSYNIKGGGMYDYYRIIFTKMPFGNDCVRINQWNLFGMPDINNKEGFSIQRSEDYVPFYNTTTFSDFTISKPLHQTNTSEAIVDNKIDGIINKCKLLSQ